MTYTPNVPLGNQTVAFTTNLIRENFGYINDTSQVEHQFNNQPNGGQANGTHLRTSMPNQADPVSLPAGTNGMYYVSGGQARYSDGTNVSQLSLGNPALNGYQWTGRVLTQWGRTPSNNNVTTTVFFPIPFTTAVYNIQVTRFRVDASAPAVLAYIMYVDQASIQLDRFSIISRDGREWIYSWTAIGR